MSVRLSHPLDPRNEREAILLSNFGDMIDKILWMPAFVYGVSGNTFLTQPTFLYKSATRTYIVDARDVPDYDFSHSYPWLTYIRMESNIIPDLPEIDGAIIIDKQVPDGKIFNNDDDYRLLFGVLRRAFVDLNQPMSNIRMSHVNEFSDSKAISSVTIIFTGVSNDIVTGLFYSEGDIFIVHDNKIRLYAKVQL